MDIKDDKKRISEEKKDDNTKWLQNNKKDHVHIT